MKCPNCQHEEVEGAFCSECGAALTSQEEQLLPPDQTKEDGVVPSILHRKDDEMHSSWKKKMLRKNDLLPLIGALIFVYFVYVLFSYVVYSIASRASLDVHDTGIYFGTVYLAFVLIGILGVIGFLGERAILRSIRLVTSYCTFILPGSLVWLLLLFIPRFTGVEIPLYTFLIAMSFAFLFVLAPMFVITKTYVQKEGRWPASYFVVLYFVLLLVTFYGLDFFIFDGLLDYYFDFVT